MKSVQPIRHRPSAFDHFIDITKPLVRAVIRVAVQTFYIGYALLITQSALPLSLHPFILPIAALSSTFFASHFYADSIQFPERPLKPSPLPPVERAPAPIEAPLLPRAPKGFINLRNNCAICSILHFLMADPVIEQWLRTEPIFRPLFTRYDEAEGAVEGIQALRQEIHRIDSNIPASSEVQIDPAQVMTAIFASLPEELKWKKVIHQHLKIGRLPPPIDLRAPKEEKTPFLILNIENGKNLQTLLNEQLNSPETHAIKALGRDHLLHDYPIDRVETQIVEAPSALRIQLARFEFVRSWLPFQQSRSVKKGDLIEVPEELTFPVAGEMKRYRLTSFVHHQGESPDRGHCVAGRVEEGIKYVINDAQTRVALPEEWTHLAQGAYLLSYLPVEG